MQELEALAEAYENYQAARREQYLQSAQRQRERNVELARQRFIGVAEQIAVEGYREHGGVN